MSNLKKNPGAEVTSFGFPVIERTKTVRRAAAPEPEPEPEPMPAAPDPAEPEPDPEEIFRKKLLELERRTQEIEKEAYGKGFAQGEKDGREYGQKAVNVLRTQFERIVCGMEALPGSICRDYRRWLAETGLRLARHIVKRELRISPDIMADIAASLLEEAEEDGSLTVYLNPQDLEFIEKRSGLSLVVSGKRFVLKADPHLERGGCKVETGVQLLDGSIETQFNNLEEYLLGPESPLNAADLDLPANPEASDEIPPGSDDAAGEGEPA